MQTMKRCILALNGAKTTLDSLSAFIFPTEENNTVKNKFWILTGCCTKKNWFSGLFLSLFYSDGVGSRQIAPTSPSVGDLLSYQDKNNSQLPAAPVHRQQAGDFSIRPSSINSRLLETIQAPQKKGLNWDKTCNLLTKRQLC